MTVATDAAKQILKSNSLLECMRGWIPVGERERNGRTATVFGYPPPAPGVVYVIGNRDGELYIFNDGSAEFVEIDEEGKEHSISLEMMEKAHDILAGEHFQCIGFAFKQIEFSEDGRLRLLFTHPDGVLWHPLALVDIENRTVEYDPDHDDDDIPF